jgi:hypothetical protein
MKCSVAGFLNIMTRQYMSGFRSTESFGAGSNHVETLALSRSARRVEDARERAFCPTTSPGPALRLYDRERQDKPGDDTRVM